MNREDFFAELEECLHGEVSDREYQESLNYYRDYFQEQESLGKSEEEILRELGSARIIAHSIIDAHGLTEHDTFDSQDYREEGNWGDPGHEIINEDDADQTNYPLRKLGRTLALIGVLLAAGVILHLMMPFILVMIAVVIIINMLNRLT